MGISKDACVRKKMIRLDLQFKLVRKCFALRSGANKDRFRSKR